MGLSSLTCAKTNIPVGATAAGCDPVLAEVVVLTEGGPPFRGSYDGYGRVRGAGTVDLLARETRALMADGLAKVVLAAFHEAGDTPGSLGRNRADPGGGRNTDAFLRACHATGGFESHEGLLLAHSGIASPSLACRLDRETALAVMATRTALREEVSKLRTEGMQARGVAFRDGGRAYPHLLSIAPLDASGHRWVTVVDGMADGTAPASATDVPAIPVVVSGGGTGRKDVAEPARALVGALPVETRSRAGLIRDCEPAGEVLAMACPMGSRWYELWPAVGPARAFTTRAGLFRAVGYRGTVDLSGRLDGGDAGPSGDELEPASAPAP